MTVTILPRKLMKNQCFFMLSITVGVPIVNPYTTASVDPGESGRGESADFKETYLQGL